MKKFDLGVQENGLPQVVKATFEPDKNFDIGAGKGNPVTKEIHGGVVGVILDGRGRPFDLSTLSEDDRVKYLKEWMTEMNIYPEGKF